jgi:hypothetical protein
VKEAVVSYEQRLEGQPCDGCHLGQATYQMPAPRLGSERKRGDGRLIWDERQVEAEQGKGWRDKGTTGKPGGAGAKLIFDQGRAK